MAATVKRAYDWVTCGSLGIPKDSLGILLSSDFFPLLSINIIIIIVIVIIIVIIIIIVIVIIIFSIILEEMRR